MHIRRIVAAAAVLGVSAFVAAGCGGGVPASAICTVYGSAVPKSEYNAIVTQAEHNQTQQGQKVTASSKKTIQEQAVDYLVEQELFQQQADKLGVKVTDKQVNDQLKQLIQSYFKGDEKQYQAELKKQDITETTVKQRIREQLISEGLFDKVTKNVTISDAQAKQQYDNNPSQYEQKESRTVAHILVKSKAQAEQIYQQVKNGNQATFAKLAKKYSTDTSSASKGGVLTITKGETVPPFDKVAFSLKTGAVSPPVHSQFGWHVITARSAVTPAKQQTFKDVKSQIVSTLQQQQRSTVMQDFQTQLKNKAVKHVTCGKDYTWTVTQTNTTSSTAAAVPSTSSTSTTSSTTGTSTTSTTAGTATVSGTGSNTGTTSTAATKTTAKK